MKKFLTLLAFAGLIGTVNAQSTEATPDKDKAAKVAAVRNLGGPAVNNHGGFERRGFLEISAPWDAKNTIRIALGCASHNCAFGGAVEAVSHP